MEVNRLVVVVKLKEGQTDKRLTAAEAETFDEVDTDKVIAMTTLSALYAQFADPITGRFPERFQRELLEVCAAVYGPLLQNGGDAIDLGASRGWHTKRMRQAVGNAPGKIVAVEPNRVLASALANNRDGRIRVMQKAAVARRSRPLPFTASAKYTALGSVVPNYIRDRFPKEYLDAELDTYEVETTTLDDIIQDCALFALRFVKIDVEGVDLDVLMSSELPFAARAGILFEINKSPLLAPLFRKISDHAYVAYDCFMNQLDKSAWLRTAGCPIDRVLLPVETSVEILGAIKCGVEKRWRAYHAGASSRVTVPADLVHAVTPN